MARAGRIAAGAGIVFAVAFALLVLGILVLTQTDWGREQVRRYALGQLHENTEGLYEVGRLEGNLLHRAVLVDVSITDLQGRPFVRADTVSTGYSILPLLRRRIVLSGTRLVNAQVILDQPPGEKWNFARIFPVEPTPPDEPPGWGDWIDLEDVELIDSRVMVRSEWKPDPDLSPAQRRQAIAEARAGETRQNIQPVGDGFQNIMDFRQLHARLPRLRIADPDADAMLFDVAAFSGIAQPFRPPVAEIHDLVGAFRLSSDSLWFDDARARMPGSLIGASGVYHLETAELLLGLRGEPAAFADLRWLYPPLPEEGGGPMTLRVHLKEDRTGIFIDDADVRVRESEVAGRLGFVLNETVRFEDTDLRFANLDTRLLERVLQTDLPRQGRLTGRAALTGPPTGMRLDGDVAFVDEVAGLNRIAADGIVRMEEPVRFGDLDLRFDPLRVELVEGFAGELPVGGAITGRLTLDGPAAGPLNLNGDLTLTDPRTGISRVLATGAVVPVVADPVVRDLRLVFRPLRAGVVRLLGPDLPPHGAIEGRLRLDGRLTGLLSVDGDLALRDPVTGLSRVAASGAVDLGEPLRIRDLDVRLDPLQVALIEEATSPLPVGGTLSGVATVSGAPAEHLLLSNLDLVHLDRGERSRIAGTAEIAVSRERAAVDLRLLPLSLRTVGRFAPDAGLRGAVAGTLEASGALGDLALRADLETHDGGQLTVAGTLDLVSERIGYDIDARVADLDLDAITALAPATTSLTGLLSAAGRGVDPATMRARFSADLVGPRVDDVEADSVRLRAAIAEGMAVVDSSIVRIADAFAWLDGSFGLVATRHGELAYRIAIDSLHALAAWLPAADTGVVDPRPVVRREAIDEVRERERREAEARQVELLATGRAPAAPGPVDTMTIGEIPRDSLAGSVHAQGVLAGNVERFELVGEAELEDVFFQGNYVGHAWIEHLLGIGLPRPVIEVDAEFHDLLAAGFAFDSATARVRHLGGRYGDGRAVIAAYQNDDTDLRADFDFALALERNEIMLRDAGLRFDTVNWSLVRPGAVSWGEPGIEIENIELVSDIGGRILLDGTLPVDADGDLDLVLESVNLENITAILQEENDVHGAVSLEARVSGTLRSPRLEGWLELLDAEHDDRELPDTRATFEYADAELAVDAEFVREEVVLGTVEARLPIDLSIIDAATPRLLDEQIAIDLRSDSIPLDVVTLFTDAVEDVRGLAMGDISVRGTFGSPILDGAVEVQDAAFRIVASGVRYEDARGSLRFDGDRLVVDSLVARARGTIRVTGELDLADLTAPGFDLEIVARNALVYAIDDNRLAVDAEIEVAGPFDAVAITGDVRTRRSVIYLPADRPADLIDLEDPAIMARLSPELLAERDRLFPEMPLLENLSVDLRISVAPDTWVRATDVNIEIFTDPEVGPLEVRIDQGLRQIVVEGVLNAERGEYEFMSRRFVITRGTASFVGGRGLDPILQIVAEHEVRMAGREALEIRIVIGGTVTDPDITVESNAEPPLSQTDLLAFIAFGRDAASLMQQQGSALSGQAAGAGDLVGNVAGLASRQLGTIAANVMLDEFESEMARELGLDMLHIAPADLPAELFTGRFEDLRRGTRIEAGRYIGPRLFLVAQARPTTETRPGLRLEYQSPVGFRWRTGIEPRFLATVPTLRDIEPVRTSVFGAFVFRQWRF